MGQPRSIGGHLRGFPHRLGGAVGARFSGHFAGSLFSGLFFDRCKDFFSNRRRFSGYWWRFVSYWWRFVSYWWRFVSYWRRFVSYWRRFVSYWRRFVSYWRRFVGRWRRLFGYWRRFVSYWRRFVGRWRRLFGYWRRFFGGGSHLFWRRTAFRYRFAYRRFRGAFGRVRPTRLGTRGEEERCEHERDNQPKRQASFGQHPRRGTLDQLDHVRFLTYELRSPFEPQHEFADPMRACGS